jgi:hypothetical protein
MSLLEANSGANPLIPSLELWTFSVVIGGPEPAFAGMAYIGTKNAVLSSMLIF